MSLIPEISMRIEFDTLSGYLPDTIPEFLALIVFILFFIQSIFIRPKIKLPPFCSSWTRLGPSSLRHGNPMEFIANKRKELKSNVFSCYFYFHRITFVFGKDNVAAVTSAPNDILNFEESYSPFLGAAFGANMLTAYTIEPQVTVLKKYLDYENLQKFASKSGILASRLIKEKLGPRGECNLVDVIRDVVFSVGVRNFLGDKFLDALNAYDFNTIFSGFEQANIRVAINYGPKFLIKLVDYLEKRRYSKIKTEFEKIVLRLASEPVTEPSNMLEELVFRHKEKNGPTLADDQTLVNLVKLFVFGSSFNSYNLVCFILTAFIEKKGLWAKLREEQKRIGFDPKNVTQEKIAEMKLLQEEMMLVASENTFPFLLRTVKQPFELDGYTIPNGDIIAWSQKISDNPLDNLLFGQGVHNCPATKYAKNSMMVVLASFIHHYSFRISAKETFVNGRIITFSGQKPTIVDFERDQE